MGVRFMVGDMLTGRRIQNVPVVSGSWSEVLNDAGDVSCTVSLKDPAVQRLGLRESAAEGKAFLAALDGDTVLQAGPIWFHDYDGDTQQLTLTASGMWSYFDHRVLLPVLAGRNPTDATTDTRFSNIVSDDTDPGYPWPTDTRKTLQGIALFYVAQAQTWTGGNVPVILPAEVVGATNERWVKGSDLAYVGSRLADLTSVEGGPDIMFTPRLQSDRQGVEWVMRIGTPTDPHLFSLQRQKFHIGNAKSSVSKLQVRGDGTRMASQAFGSGGRTVDQALISVSTDSTLTDANYPLLEAVDSSHSDVSEIATMQGYSDEIVAQGKAPQKVWQFIHDLSQRPFLGAFNAGDFADVRVHADAYLSPGTHSMRVLTRAGDETGTKVDLTFYPEAI
jgi:hypothetical protein